MKPLSKEASAALSALKAADPTSEDEARVRKNLERALGVAIPVAGVAAVTTAAGAKAATGLFSALGVGAKVALVVVVVSSVGAVVSLSSRGGEGRGEEPSTTTQKPSRPPEPEVAVVPPPPPPEVVAAVTAPTKPRAPQPKPPPEAPAIEEAIAEPAPTPPSPPPTAETWNLEVEANFPNCDAATELRSATSARKLLNENRAEDAVWLLGAYQRRCPSGRWSDEAWSVRMAGLCKLNRTAEVIGLLQWFSAEYPARRVAVISDLRSSCSDEVLAPFSTSSPSPRGGESRGEGVPNRE